MVKKIVKDSLFLAQKSMDATEEDNMGNIQVGQRRLFETIYR